MTSSKSVRFYKHFYLLIHYSVHAGTRYITPIHEFQLMKCSHTKFLWFVKLFHKSTRIVPKLI